ncbi:hypothetical protein LF1_04510 [Rubripirellula obstinata]|uniref:UVR domain-containing protein n=1 Tax=Rubripirellula obstinata TaxID=406547 RepID=A0A5B1CEE4_9BACT|nr:hypothetical protein [Rubripirellula obstinata]KAA1257960.1 hypothetical protein LF1_04510 [Rubripirellula obstinata]
MESNAKCSKCGQPAAGMLVGLAKCASCSAAEHASTIHTIEEADEFIADATRNLQKLEAYISKHPEMPEIPQGLEAFAMTPLTAYHNLQMHLAAFKSRRMALVTATDSKEMLDYEIRKAIEAEDFERAAILKSRIQDQQP